MDIEEHKNNIIEIIYPTSKFLEIIEDNIIVDHAELKKFFQENFHKLNSNMKTLFSILLEFEPTNKNYKKFFIIKEKGILFQYTLDKNLVNLNILLERDEYIDTQLGKSFQSDKVEQRSPLYVSALFQKNKILKKLLELGANIKSEEQPNLLKACLFMRNEIGFKMLLASGIKIENINEILCKEFEDIDNFKKIIKEVEFDLNDFVRYFKDKAQNNFKIEYLIGEDNSIEQLYGFIISNLESVIYLKDKNDNIKNLEIRGITKEILNKIQFEKMFLVGKNELINNRNNLPLENFVESLEDLKIFNQSAKMLFLYNNENKSNKPMAILIYFPEIISFSDIIKIHISQWINKNTSGTIIFALIF